MYATVPTTAPDMVCPAGGFPGAGTPAMVSPADTSAGTAAPAPPWPAVRALAASVEPATPKSITRPSPSASTMMLAGLRSRWTTPAA